MVPILNLKLTIVNVIEPEFTSTQALEYEHLKSKYTL